MTNSSPDKAVSPEAGAMPAPGTPTPEPTAQAPEATVALRSSQRSTMSLPVVIPALLVLTALLLVCVLAPDAADRLFSGAQRWVVASFDWFYVMALSAFLLFLVVLAASRYGDIRLGPDDAKPEFSFVSWSSMLFAAGMGIGLMYFGVGEPLQHFLSPPTQEPGTPAAAREAMEATFFHWGFHAWAVYGTMGLVLAYFGFRYNLPLTMRSGLYPLLRDRINGPIGHGVDAFALVGTIAGIATTLGYGARQIAAGIHTLTGWETESSGFLVAVIVVVVTLASLSALLGVDKGVRRLSEFNMLLSVLLLSFVVIAGPTAHIFKALSENIGNYLQGLVGMSLRTFAYAPSREEGWFGGWTILYWAWWVSWSPFVGMFIARISRGRTVREFVIGVLLVPTAFNLLWMTAFGNGAIWADANLAGGALAQTATNVDALLFRFFEYLPWVKPVSWLAVLLIGVFFITSADSGALVVNSIASRGNNESPVWQRLFWCVLLGLTSIVLLHAGGLGALQAVTLVAALPVAFILLVLCVGLWRGMVADLAHYSPDLAPATNFWSGQHWRKRLEQIVHQPLKADVQRFLQATVLPAMNEVAAEMQKRGLQAHVQDSLESDADSEVRLVVPVEKLRDFVYGVRAVRRTIPTFTVRESAGSKERRYMYEPVTFFEDGRSGYDVQYLRSEELIADILRQYERYLSLSADKRTQMLNRAPGHTDPV